MSMLCSLSDLKTMLRIAQDDTTQDAKLNLMIKQTSALIEGFLGYSLKRAEYTEELHSTNDRQLIQLNHFPLQSVSSVFANDVSVEDYKVLPEYARWGRLYRGNGWSGACYTRGFTHDVVAGVWNIKVTYIAGYYLPGDTGYVEGAEDSLPYDIITCCLNSIVEKYNFEAMGAKGLKAHTEGHISDTYADSANDIGLSESAKKVLSKYVYYGIA